MSSQKMLKATSGTARADFRRSTHNEDRILEEAALNTTAEKANGAEPRHLAGSRAARDQRTQSWPAHGASCVPAGSVSTCFTR